MDEALALINGLLATEQACGPVNGLDDLMGRRQRRMTIKQHLTLLELELQRVREQEHRLPALPPLIHMHWAQAVLAFPNLAFLEVDTTGLSADAEIIRVMVMDAQSSAVLDQLVKPSRHLTAEISRITGISNQDVEQAPAITQVWERLRKAIQGSYVLSYNLDFDMGKLKETARRHNLEEELAIIEECLMQRAMLYFDISSYPKLETLCRRIGHPLPEQPRQTALDRARGQIHLLSAMANAIIGRDSAASPDAGSEVDLDDEPVDLDDLPF